MQESFAIPGVGGIIEKVENGQDFILLQKRCKQDAPDEFGLLEIPAGKVRAFENVYDCLRREISEETGLSVVTILGETDAMQIQLDNYKINQYQPFTCAQNLEGDYPIMVQIFICSCQGRLLESSDESQHLKWVSLRDLKSSLGHVHLFYPMHVLTLKQYLLYKGY